MTPEEMLQQLFIEKGMTLSLAESCTGGAVSARLTRLPGASRYFLGAVVSYSNALKTSLLAVPSPLIEEKGAVSQEVVEAMAVGILAKTGSDIGAAISGIAGPTGGSADKPLGTVWMAVCKQGELPHSKKLLFTGSREVVIQSAATTVIEYIVSLL